jgi:hypothetical protein
MGTPMTDGRLAWLAVRDQLFNRARPASLLARLLRRGRRSSRIRRNAKLLDAEGWVAADVGDKMGDYALAVDEVASHLSAQERLRLRETGTVPEWFLDAVEQEVAARRQRR